MTRRAGTTGPVGLLAQAREAGGPAHHKTRAQRIGNPAERTAGQRISR